MGACVISVGFVIVHLIASPFRSFDLMLSLYYLPPRCAAGAAAAQRVLGNSGFSSVKRGKILWNCDGAQRASRANTRFAPTGVRGEGVGMSWGKRRGHALSVPS